MSIDPAEIENAPSAPAEPDLPGPFAVGRYARELRERMREMARVRLVGEVVNFKLARNGNGFFELRDGEGAVPCAIWGSDLDSMHLPDGALRDGVEVVVAGGVEYYPGSGTSSPRMTFRATHVRLAGEGDLLARLEQLRRRLHADGVFEPQKGLTRPLLPKGIGVVTAESGAARRDLVAALGRRGWAGTLVWAFAPVQDRHAAPAITTAIVDLAARPEIDVIVVCRGGGSLTDLWAFCDETLCRTVGLLAKPVISAVGHETDRTLIDDVAAHACSTPTHAAEAAVPLDCTRARADVRERAGRIAGAGRTAVARRARELVAMARVPAGHVRGHRSRLHQTLREMRASAARGLHLRSEHQRRVAANVLSRKAAAATGALERARAENGELLRELDRCGDGRLGRQRQMLERAALALRAHDPERVLERGFALVEDSGGEVVTTAEAAVAAGTVGVRFRDGRVSADVRGRGEGDEEVGERER